MGKPGTLRQLVRVGWLCRLCGPVAGNTPRPAAALRGVAATARPGAGPRGVGPATGWAILPIYYVRSGGKVQLVFPGHPIFLSGRPSDVDRF